jgi:signal transduction histidine kinase
MRIRSLLQGRPSLPRRTVRLRLTIVFATLFLAAGATLQGITYVLVKEATSEVLVATRDDGSTVAINTQEGSAADKRPGGDPPPVVSQLEASSTGGVSTTRPSVEPMKLAQAQRDEALAKAQHATEMRVLLEKSGIALAIMAALSIVLGWLAAGRVLRPLRTLNERAREISASNLHKRLALAGPDDELKQLADTFDDLLGRLEGSFAAQRQFVANASHELRTPLTRAQTLTEVALRDPEASVESLRATHQRVLATAHEQERLIEALLTLARSERGLASNERLDLAALTQRVLDTHKPADDLRLYVHATLQPAEVSGEPRLIERLIANLVENAQRYNHRHGHIDVTTTTAPSGRVVLSVANSGPVVRPEEVAKLFEAFERHGSGRRSHSNGLGLGLSIVKAIAAAHTATVNARPLSTGGLEIEISFPPPIASASDTAATKAGTEVGAGRRARRFLQQRPHEEAEAS